MNKKIIFRADGNSHIGLGHIVRSLALAEHLSANFYCIFAIIQPTPELTVKIKSVCNEIISLPDSIGEQEDSNIFIQVANISNDDIIIVDGYSFNESYQKTLKNTGALLVFIDDLHKGFQYSDIIINASAQVKASDYITGNKNIELCLGYDYALLRPDFLVFSSIERVINKINNLFICLGGADPNNLTIKILRAAQKSKRFKEIHIVIGTSYVFENILNGFLNENTFIHKNLSAPKLIEVLKNCDLVVCSSSGIMTECFALGKGVISGYFADNQFEIYEYAVLHNLIVGIGNLQKVSETYLTEVLDSIKIETINNQISLQKKLIDGKSLRRIERIIFKKYFIKKAIVKKTKLTDIELYFEWTNDIEVRKNSINQEKILFINHEQWFISKIKDPETYMYVILLDDVPFGQVRFEHIENYYVINYSIAPAARGRGIGAQFLQLAISKLKEELNDECIILFGQVKPENIASKNIFIKLGFEETINNKIINFTLLK